MSSSRSRSNDDLRPCDDHFHLKINDIDEHKATGVTGTCPPAGHTKCKNCLKASGHKYVTGQESYCAVCAHNNDYTPFIVVEALQGPFCVLQRMGSDIGDFYCENWKEGHSIPPKRYEYTNLRPLDTSWKYSEGDWKLYRLEDISERPFPSDLAGNDGLREDFARRENNRSRGSPDGRGLPPMYQTASLGTSFSLGSEETLVPGSVRAARHASSGRWGDSQETLL